MGRRQYLERLALGRSAYQDVALQQPPQLATAASASSASSSTAQDPMAHTSTQQEYDARGRPINPATDRFNTEQRKAQNGVLALVGVVERNDETEHVNRLRYAAFQKARQTLLTDEDERGELLRYAGFASRFLLHIWPDALRQRFQIGLHDVSLSLVEILSAEWRQPWRGGTGWFLAGLFPGAASTIAHHVIRFALMLVAEQVTGELQTRISKKIEKQKTLKYLDLSTAWIFEALLLGIDVAILPLEYYAATQLLGLAPALPLLPSLQFCSPWHSPSFHSSGWRGVVGNRFFKIVTSPAAVLLMRKMMASDASEDVLPVFGLITDFGFPEVDGDPIKVSAPKLNKDPVGWVLYQCYSLRSRFLQRSGWTLVKRDETRQSRGDEHERYIQVQDGGQTVVSTHRSTTLAQLPAQFLADAIDALSVRILVLPFEAIMMRTIAVSFIVPSTASTRTAPLLYAPFGGGPFTYGSAVLGRYAGRIGLSLALSASVDVVLFFGIYKAVRHIGKNYLDWGKREKIGDIITSEEGVEELADRNGD